MNRHCFSNIFLNWPLFLRLKIDEAVLTKLDKLPFEQSVVRHHRSSDNDSASQRLSKSLDGGDQQSESPNANRLEIPTLRYLVSFRFKFLYFSYCTNIQVHLSEYLETTYLPRGR
jgi:hypothetical protein